VPSAAEPQTAADEIAACMPYLHRQIALIRPKVIVALGGTAGEALLDARKSLGELRGKVHSYGGIPLVVTYHPAALLRNPNWKKPTWDDVRIARQLSRPLIRTSVDQRHGSPEAEQAVLGAMLLDQDAALRAVELVDDTMFYREEHRRLFRAMRALVERRSVIDPVTLNDELERRSELGQVGGPEYVAELVDAAPTAANLEHHTRILRDKAILRRLIEASTRRLRRRTTAAPKRPSSSMPPKRGSSTFLSSGSTRDLPDSRRCCGRPWSASKRSSEAAKRLPGSPAGS
jgi:hypothetical protein